jgi:hypothetical protein
MDALGNVTFTPLITSTNTTHESVQGCLFGGGFG